jgi:hypothetical protein
MAEWVFRCFLSTHGRDLIDQWIEDLPKKARARFFDVITALRDQPRDLWTRPDFAPLRPPCGGLGEIRFDCAGVEYRALGFFASEVGVFTLVYGAIEKGGEFKPPDTCKTAQQRKKLALAHRERSHVCDF